MVTFRVRSVMWFAAGLALAVVLVWTLSAWRASALPGPDESTFVSVTPARILDTRDPTNIGLAGPFVSAVPQDLTVTGSVPTTTGTQTVVPAGSTGVVLNVTIVSPTANGFLSIRPADAPGLPTTSSLNFNAGDITPNAVSVLVPTAGADAGKIEITYDAYGTPGPRTDVLIDVVGYTTSTGLLDLTNRLVALEAKQPRIASSAVNGFPTLSNAETLTTVAITVPAGGKQNVYIEGAASIFTNSTQVTACTSVGFCNIGIEIWDADTNTLLAPALNGAFFRLKDDNDGQVLSISAVVSASPGTHTYRLQTNFANVVDNATFLNNAELTAMTVPLDGTGVAPASITGSSPKIADDGANVAVAG